MNRKIKKARQIALGILKPSRKELEHGIELHKNFIICDAYGFAPNSAVDGDALRRVIEKGASQREVKDLFEEMQMTRHVTDNDAQQEFKEAWDASGVTCILQNAGEECQAPMRIIKRFARFTYVTDMMGDFVSKAIVPDDIKNAKRKGRHCLYFSTNGVPLAQQWDSVEEELGFIRIFFQLGCRMMHLTYNRRNMIGDGCAETSNSGLSDFGRAVIREMNRVGVIVDVAHSGQKTSLDAAKISERPVVASHIVCMSISRHCRAKTDEVIRAIADTGGYIGICCIPRFLGGKGDISAMLDHIDYAVKTFGADHVAIGTDKAYNPISDEQEVKKIPKSRSLRPEWRSLWPSEDLRSDPKWQKEERLLSMEWTNWPLFTVGLVQRGYSDKDIQKVIGGNVLRIAREVLSK